MMSSLRVYPPPFRDCAWRSKMPINLRQEEDVADFLLWISFLTALASGAFFTAQIKFGICGWEGASRPKHKPSRS
jgi:hypothetical protein